MGCKYRRIFNLFKTNNKKNQFVHSHIEPQFMVLAIDIGNSRTKAAVFEGSNLLAHFNINKEMIVDGVSTILAKYDAITDIVVASVAEEALLLSSLPKVEVHFVSHLWPFPFTNLYDTPLTLGIDRMVLATGAVLQFPKRNRLVVDAGTCITYDCIDSEDNYLGGAISPGLRLRYEALHSHTAKLPLLKTELPPELVGKSTNASIHSGVVNGLVFEIEGFMTHYKENLPNFIIILTGGDAVFLAERLKNTIFANSNFLLESLNQTFQYKITHV